VAHRQTHRPGLGLGDGGLKKARTRQTYQKRGGLHLKSRVQTKNFGKRRATRYHSWLKKPVHRLGALVFRLGQIRKSHRGLAPMCSDQDPDSRLCDRPMAGDTRRKNVFSPKFFGMRHGAGINGCPDPFQRGFLRDRRALKYSSAKNSKGRGPNEGLSLIGDEHFVALVPVIPWQVAPQQSLPLFHRTRNNMKLAAMTRNLSHKRSMRENKKKNKKQPR
jgi:hypothetical protein